MSEIIVKMTEQKIKLKGGEYVRDLVRCERCKFRNNCERTIQSRALEYCSAGEEEIKNEATKILNGEEE